jgi:2'-5' RNA ligase
MTESEIDEVKDHWYWRPGWQVGSRFYTWHITFEDQPEVIELAERYRSTLEKHSSLDLVPERWLHLTMQGIGFVEDVDAEQVDQIVERARTRCRSIPPFDLSLGSPHVDPESIQITVQPADSVRTLRREIRAAIGDVWGTDGVPEPAEPYTPHMSLAYINSAGPAAPLAAALREVSGDAAHAKVKACQLIVLNRDNKMYVWEPYATVALGDN